MGSDLHVQVERGIEELRRSYSSITACHGALQVIRERDEVRYSLSLDIRWRQRKIVINGPLRETAGEAVRAALDEARKILDSPQ
jgi:hypothetical protein